MWNLETGHLYFQSWTGNLYFRVFWIRNKHLKAWLSICKILYAIYWVVSAAQKMVTRLTLFNILFKQVVSSRSQKETQFSYVRTEITPSFLEVIWRQWNTWRWKFNEFREVDRGGHMHHGQTCAKERTSLSDAGASRDEIKKKKKKVLSKSVRKKVLGNSSWSWL